jgi:hypothetical protein
MYPRQQGDSLQPPGPTDQSWLSLMQQNQDRHGHTQGITPEHIHLEPVTPKLAQTDDHRPSLTLPLADISHHSWNLQRKSPKYDLRGPREVFLPFYSSKGRRF